MTPATRGFLRARSATSYYHTIEAVTAPAPPSNNPPPLDDDGPRFRRPEVVRKLDSAQPNFFAVASPERRADDVAHGRAAPSEEDVLPTINRVR